MHLCPTCNKEFKNVKALNAHQVSHKTGTRYYIRRERKDKLERITSNCLHCNKQIIFVISKPKQYCSNLCQQTYRIYNSIANGNYTRSTAFSYFRKVTPHICSECSIDPIWNGKPLTLQIDHIDGNNKNNILENLRYLCPNCHTQTETWGFKKR